MKKWSVKYRIEVSKLILLAFLLLNFSNVLHYHHVEINSTDCFEIDSGIGIQISNLTGNHCSVYQNFTSVHTLTFPKTNYTAFDNTYQNQRLILFSNSFVNIFLYSYHQLRAPPSVS